MEIKYVFPLGISKVCDNFYTWDVHENVTRQQSFRHQKHLEKEHCIIEEITQILCFLYNLKLQYLREFFCYELMFVNIELYLPEKEFSV